MESKREEERKEKIIRGLMKLPPNRRCINCNSLGPQYVCINFWTFICMTCSGIHREFTHRVKSVSLSKFTSQEVEALQKGGNQRARETFLMDWDLERQRLPNSSDVESVRQFIKNVYVDRKFSVGKNSGKPPKDMQGHHGCIGKETRRASSYHSFSQSPPYDFHYEDRQSRKQGATLTRKPGSDGGHYNGKISSFVYSPSHFSEHAFEDQFATEASSSQVSDYSVSSGGDPFRSGPQSPNSQKDAGFNSPTLGPSRGIFFDDVQHQKVDVYSEANAKKDTVEVPPPQRTTSSGSFGSFDGRSVSLKTVNPCSSMDAFSETGQFVAAHQNKVATFPSFLLPSSSVNSGDLDLFKEPLGSHPFNLSPPTDLFQTVATSATSPHLLQPASDSSAPPIGFYSSQTSPSSYLSFFNVTSQKPSEENTNERFSKSSVPNNEDWATFDLPHHTAIIPDSQDCAVAQTYSGVENSTGTSDPVSSSSTIVKWPESQSSTALGSLPLFSSSWHEGLHNICAPSNASSIQDASGAGFQESASDGDLLPSLFSHMPAGSLVNDAVLPFMGEVQSHVDHIPGNPFDILDDSATEASNVFLDMSSLTAALPSMQLPSSFVGDITQSWFPQDTLSPYEPTSPSGGLSYMSAQAASSQLQNVSMHGPVASFGGNPFA
ncbi:hypothetical protein Nepgr_011499 [Nepenthes gracilis]|uniref:Arf-GAP domain-containing protein n=1 Tax=Nepenthes gracilis TaxID=150966 RepID=A0AAD3XM03_NEPGR|nr:hypothetical protein Nepgr_011499 [Nepenthes gracilis]